MPRKDWTKLGASFGVSVGILLLFQASLPMGRAATETEDRREVVARLVSEARALGLGAQVDSAMALADLAAEKARQWFGEEDSSYVSALIAQASCAFALGDAVRSEWARTKAVLLSERIFGAEHAKVALALSHLYSHHLRFRGIHIDSLIQRAISINKQAYGPQSRQVAAAMQCLGRGLLETGCCAESDSVLDLVEHLHERNFGRQSAQVATVLGYRGDRCLHIGQFARAEEYFLEAIAAVEGLEGHSSRLAHILDGLSKLCLIMARYDEAETYLRRCMHVIDSHEESWRWTCAVTAMNHLGSLYSYQGKHAESEEAYREALRLRLKVQGPHNPEIAEPLNNLGNLCEQLGRYAEAEDFFKRALKAREEHPLYGPQHPYLVYSLNGLGWVYTEQGRYSEAAAAFNRALSNVKDAYGPEHPHVAWCLSALGNLSRIQGDYVAAERHLTRALNITEKTHGSHHPETAGCLRDLAVLYGSTGDISRSVANYNGMRKLRADFIRNAFSHASEGQKMRWISQYPLIDHSFLALSVSHPSQDILRSALEMVLQGKAAVIDAVMAEKQAVYCSYDDRVTRNVEAHSDLCGRIAQMALTDASCFPKEMYRDSLQVLYSIKDSLETQISSWCSEFRDELATQDVRVSDITDALTEKAVLWEFVRYKPYDFNGTGGDEKRSGSPRYLAFTLNHLGDIAVADLGNAEELDSLVSTARKMIYGARFEVRSPRMAELERELNRVTGQLYARIFAPLEPTLADRTEILICPDGQLSLLPFEILPQPDGEYVVESLSKSYLSSGRELVRAGSKRKCPDLAIVVAGPDFDLTSKAPSPQPSGKVSAGDTLPLGNGFFRGAGSCLQSKFRPLSYSFEELESVVTVLRRKGQLHVDTYYGDNALEGVLKGLKTAPRVLHLTTHGYFCEDLSSSETTIFENPLLRSGLALAGANRLIDEPEPHDTECDDGILTALEVSALDLMGTDLAVLSACETGVGDVKNGEGVFGLRRAFQHAGARTIVMSLWKVPDRETYELMDHFYNIWLSGNSKKAALRKSVLRVIDSLRERYGTAHPYFWGAFVLAGDPS